MLKWEKIGDLYVAHVSDECAYTVEHDMDTTHGGWRSTFTTASEWRLHDTLKEAKTACEADYAHRVAEIAAANGYVKADPPITSMHDPRLGIKKPEPWHIDIDALAVSAGYVKLEPGQVVVDAAEVSDALDALCDTCAGECSMCRVKDVLSAIKEARDE